MTIGLIGSSLIQVYWFNWSMQQQEARFDTHVFDALNKIEERLSALESRTPAGLLSALNTIPSHEIRIEITHYMEEAGWIDSTDIAHIQTLEDSVLQWEYLMSFLEPMDHWRRQSTFWEILDERRYTTPDIADRIDPAKLDNLIREELESRGIRLPYQYGVIQSVDTTFVIINGNYVVGNLDESAASHVDHPASRNLFNSPYQVALYRQDAKASPGWLKLHFPSKTSWLWYSLLPTMLMAILFTILILFCFSYTIYVILRQKKISEMKTDFINNMTHEFKTPIATISLAADSIASPKVIHDESKITRFINIIRQENRRMLQQVEKVLQMAQLDKEDFQLKLSEVDMHDIIRQAVENVNLLVQQRQGRIEMKLEAIDPIIEGDQNHLSNMIHNLLDNANKYSDGPPDITVITNDLPEGLEIVIEDKGIGMSKEDQKHIFEKFYRVHTGNVHNVKGFGLGLSYVRAMALAHQGSVSVRSELGKGSRFTLVLPHRQKKK